MTPTLHLGQNPKQIVLSNMRILSAKFQIVNERIAFFKYVDTYGTTLTQGEGTEVQIIQT